MNKPTVEIQGGMVYLIGKINVSNGTIDGKFSSWIEMPIDDARKMAEEIISAMQNMGNEELAPLHYFTIWYCVDGINYEVSIRATDAETAKKKFRTGFKTQGQPYFISCEIDD